MKLSLPFLPLNLVGLQNFLVGDELGVGVAVLVVEGVGELDADGEAVAVEVVDTVGVADAVEVVDAVGVADAVEVVETEGVADTDGVGLGGQSHLKP